MHLLILQSHPKWNNIAWSLSLGLSRHYRLSHSLGIGSERSSINETILASRAYPKFGPGTLSIAGVVWSGAPLCRSYLRSQPLTSRNSSRHPDVTVWVPGLRIQTPSEISHKELGNGLAALPSFLFDIQAITSIALAVPSLRNLEATRPWSTAQAQMRTRLRHLCRQR